MRGLEQLEDGVAAARQRCVGGCFHTLLEPAHDRGHKSVLRTEVAGDERVVAAGIARDLPKGRPVGPDAGVALPGSFQDGFFSLSALEITHPTGHWTEATVDIWGLNCHAVVIFGEGYGVTVFEGLPWLARDTGCGYLVCGWPEAGRPQIEAFAREVMPEFVD